MMTDHHKDKRCDATFTGLAGVPGCATVDRKKRPKKKTDGLSVADKGSQQRPVL
jgi:hypothetical protein